MADAIQPERASYESGSSRHEIHRGDDVTVLGTVLKRTSWGALIAGTVAAISTQMILTVLGIAIGVTTSEVVSGADRVQAGMKTGAAIWWLASGTLSLFIGGCVVGRFAGMTRSPDVLLHGFTMWAVTALFGFFVVTTGAGALYGTAMNATYVGTQSVRGGQPNTAATDATGRAVSGPTGSLIGEGMGVAVTTDEAQRYVRTASWWTLLGLLIGIGASLAGSWFTAPDRIAVRPTSQINAASRATRPTAIAPARSS